MRRRPRRGTRRRRMKAIWNGTVIAESDDTVVVEGNHYFPQASIRPEYFADSDNRSVCHWKGTANYFHLEVGGQRNPNAAWTYRTPSAQAADIAGHVAFWRGVEVVPS
ncbi:DUF427 domain-containing protein [Agromyces tropicus]|uniref:DUF427 domain-containing protein n=2 Tax=Agromyces tropicus TaxID=555371 RepID=A0ABP5G3S9_9MICO